MSILFVDFFLDFIEINLLYVIMILLEVVPMGADKYKVIFSKNLNKYLKLNGKTQVDIVHDLGFNKSAVSTWCNGTRLPRMDKVDSLAKYFGINRSDLIEDDKDTQDTYYFDHEARETAEFLHKNPDYKVLFDASRKVKKEDIDFVKKMIEKFSE